MARSVQGLMDSVSALFTPASIFTFFLGVGVTVLYYKLKDRHLDKTCPEDAPHHTHFKTKWIMYGLAAIVILGIFIKTNVADARAQEALVVAKEQAATAQAYSKRTNECLTQVLYALNNQRSDNAIRRDKNAQDRSNNPYPDPTCGLIEPPK